MTHTCRRGARLPRLRHDPPGTAGLGRVPVTSTDIRPTPRFGVVVERFPQVWTPLWKPWERRSADAGGRRPELVDRLLRPVAAAGVGCGVAFHVPRRARHLLRRRHPHGGGAQHPQPRSHERPLPVARHRRAARDRRPRHRPRPAGRALVGRARHPVRPVRRPHRVGRAHLRPAHARHRWRHAAGRAHRGGPPPRHGRRRPRRRDQPPLHLRRLRHRLVQPLRPRRGPGGGRDARPRPTTRSSSTATPGWARPTCCTPSATTSRRTTPPTRSATSPPRPS